MLRKLPPMILPHKCQPTNFVIQAFTLTYYDKTVFGQLEEALCLERDMTRGRNRSSGREFAQATPGQWFPRHSLTHRRYL